MRFHKRPKSKHEIALAMGTSICICSCDCSHLVCSCPPIPTHQIQLDQSSQGYSDVNLQAGLAASAAV